MRLARTGVLIGALSLACMVLAPPAGATEVEQAVTFGSFESDGFEEVYASVVRSNGEKVARAFLQHALEDGSGAVELRLDEASREKARGMLDGQTSLGESSARSESSGGVSPLSYSTASVFGAPVASGRAWQMSDIFSVTTCGVPSGGCTTRGTLNIRFTTDPGKLGTRTTVVLTKSGTDIGNTQLTGTVYANSSAIHTSGPTTYSPSVTTTFWNTPHSSTLGKQFSIYFVFSIYSPAVGTTTAEWKSAKSTACSEPSGGAFRCQW